MVRSIEEQADHMLRIMTVDMVIDFWQTKECAKNAVDEIIDAVKAVADNEVVTPIVIYWEKVKQAIEKR
jgi:hypothetical protein